MSKEQGYNGWANYETWLVKLWIDNDQRTYNYFNEVARNYRGHAHDLAVQIRTMVEEEVIPELNGLAADLMNASLRSVEWFDIAIAILEELGDTE